MVSKRSAIVMDRSSKSASFYARMFASLTLLACVVSLTSTTPTHAISLQQTTDQVITEITNVLGIDKKNDQVNLETNPPNAPIQNQTGKSNSNLSESSPISSSSIPKPTPGQASPPPKNSDNILPAKISSIPDQQGTSYTTQKAFADVLPKPSPSRDSPPKPFLPLQAALVSIVLGAGIIAFTIRNRLSGLTMHGS